jgi:hypothetical protein
LPRACGRSSKSVAERRVRGRGGRGKSSGRTHERTGSLLWGCSKSGRAERPRREDPLAPPVFENPAGFRVEEPWGQEVAVRHPADPTPGAEKKRDHFRGGARGRKPWGLLRELRARLPPPPRGLHFRPHVRGGNVGFVGGAGFAMPTAPSRAAAAGEKRRVFLRRAPSLPRARFRCDRRKFPARAARPSPLCETCGGSLLSPHLVFLSRPPAAAPCPPSPDSAQRLASTITRMPGERPR